ncbi:EF-hand domain-containing protein [Pseudomonas sp. TNT2022 ID642]|uniref:EF-hand domain-containing protein n=1 Tax=Pseudomonas sp. TNT2022 ID642 TaxID=2942632 RepID=UPI002362169E|nr:EF-hand domain-containing protein [Pseudomonas sp. TNT2022 ID642]MDD1000300.1 EF-hand domain-containing protein [Pseudomonas sp. TNT2022 ID642]
MAKKMTDAEQRAHLEEKYRELDLDGDGSITLEEFSKNTQGFAKELRREVWESFNLNRDDGLDLDEYLASQVVKPN